MKTVSGTDTVTCLSGLNEDNKSMPKIFESKIGILTPLQLVWFEP